MVFVFEVGHHITFSGCGTKLQFQFAIVSGMMLVMKASKSKITLTALSLPDSHFAIFPYITRLTQQRRSAAEARAPTSACVVYAQVVLVRRLLVHLFPHKYMPRGKQLAPSSTRFPGVTTTTILRLPSIHVG